MPRYSFQNDARALSLQREAHTPLPFSPRPYPLESPSLSSHPSVVWFSPLDTGGVRSEPAHESLRFFYINVKKITSFLILVS